MTDTERRHETLIRGELTVVGRIRSASNATFLCEARLDDCDEDVVHCVYKPVAGEEPLWDFPDGTLAGRELAAYLVSATLGWNVVPYTVIRHGPAGPGMVQLWVEQPEPSDETAGGPLVDLRPPDDVPAGYLSVVTAYDYSGNEVVLVHADDPQLQRMAVFDVVVNNADRKGGHILRGVDGGVYGVDHGISMHVQDKLRTVLWGWAGKPIDDEILTAVESLEDQLSSDLGVALGDHVTPEELAALGRRIRGLLDDPVMPAPDRRRPLPWPAF